MRRLEEQLFEIAIDKRDLEMIAVVIDSLKRVSPPFFVQAERDSVKP